MTEPTYNQARARFVRETTPSDQAVERVHRRVRYEVGPEGRVDSWTTREVGPTRGASARVGRRLKQSLRDRRGHRWSPGWVGRAGPASPWRGPVAVAAAALILLAWANLRPRGDADVPDGLPALVGAPPESAPAPVAPSDAEPSEMIDEPPTDGTVESQVPAAAPAVPASAPRVPASEEPVPSADAVVEVEPDERIAVLDAVGETLLSSFGGWTSARPDPRVRLRYRGEGLLTAGGDDFEIRWDTGRLEVDVEPDAGVALAVLTAEGTIRIDGTAFAVHTNAEGTRVDVTQGLVKVRCHGVAEHRFAAGEAVTCAPVDPHGVVVAAVTRYRKTGPSACDDVVTDLEWAVDQWPQDGSERVFGMALYARFRCLNQLGDRLRAKAAAEAYMESGLTGNRADVEKYLGRWK